jgi:hypothetical protein
LITASAREKFPSWAVSLVNSVRSGELEGIINLAMEII